MEHNANSNLAFRIFSLWNMIYIALCAVFFLLIIAAFIEGSVAYFFIRDLLTSGCSCGLGAENSNRRVILNL